MIPLDEKPIPDRARELADAGAWADLVSLLRAHLSTNAVDTELRVLLGEALARTGEEREARDWLESVLPILAGGQERALYRRAVNLFGVLVFAPGDLDAAYHAFTAALEPPTPAGDGMRIVSSARHALRWRDSATRTHRSSGRSQSRRREVMPSWRQRRGVTAPTHLPE